MTPDSEPRVVDAVALTAYRAVYVEVPKVACSSIKIALAGLLGVDLEAAGGNPHAAAFPEPPGPAGGSSAYPSSALPLSVTPGTDSSRATGTRSKVKHATSRPLPLSGASPTVSLGSNLSRLECHSSDSSMPLRRSLTRRLTLISARNTPSSPTDRATSPLISSVDLSLSREISTRCAICTRAGVQTEIWFPFLLYR